MNTGQTMLVIGAMSLLSLLTLSINAIIISSSTTGLEMEANINALSIGQGMLDEIMTRDFDEKATTGIVNNPSLMTDPAALGPEGVSEAISGLDSSKYGTFQARTKFDDVDDYHNYKRWVWDTRLGWFKITDTVQYIQETNPDVVSTSRTFQKKITVTIENNSLPKDLDGNILKYRLVDVAVYRKYF